MANEPSVNDPLDEVIGALIQKLQSSTTEHARTLGLLESAIDRITALEKRVDKLEAKPARRP